MSVASENQNRRRPTPTLRWSILIESIFAYVAVPFYVLPQLIMPKPQKLGFFKRLYLTWVKSVGVALSTGALLGAAEWALAKVLNRRLLDGLPALATGLGIPALIGGWLIDRHNRLRGALIAAVAMLPRILVSENWRRDHSSDEEFDQMVKTGSQQLLSVLKEEAEQKYQKRSK